MEDILEKLPSCFGWSLSKELPAFLVEEDVIAYLPVMN